jgi:hypothetical protein
LVAVADSTICLLLDSSKPTGRYLARAMQAYSDQLNRNENGVYRGARLATVARSAEIAVVLEGAAT